MHNPLPLLAALFLTITASLYAQKLPTQQPSYSISGQAVEKESGQGIPYVTVSVLSDSVKVVKRLSGDINGKFTVNVGSKHTYILSLSAVGYKEKRLPVNITESKIELGKITVDDGLTMKEVSVVAQKPLVKVDVDKLTYSIESDPDAQTNNGLDMLRKVPLISVDANENITLNGQSNFKVLVNGKSSSMMSKNFKDVIKSMPANSIKDIEVITNPSSKYDAEGVGGIINIITTKKTLNGYNGSVNVGADTRGGYNGSLYLSAKTGRLSFAGRYGMYHYQQPDNSAFTTRTNYLSDIYHYSITTNKATYNGTSNNFSGEASYDIDSLNLISMSFWGYSGLSNGKGSSSLNEYDMQNTLSRSYNNTSPTRNTYGTLSGNVDYQRTFKKPDKSFTISYKLDNNPSTNKYETEIYNTFNYTPYHQRTNNDAYGREQTLQIDYYDPLTEKHQIECGIKGIYRQNSSNTNNYLLDQTSGTWSDFTAKNNDLDYDQYILGAYAGYVFKLKKLSVKSGVRAEFTWDNAKYSWYRSATASDTIIRFNNHLHNIIPYITLAYQIGTGKTLKLSYTQRLYRPGIWYLNPYINDADPLDIQYGNPNLNSEIANSFELGFSSFTSKLSLNLSSNCSFTNNSIVEISSMDANGVRSTTYDNIGSNFDLGVNGYISYRPNQKINVYFNGGTGYNSLSTNNGEDISNHGIYFRGSLGLRFTLWKNGTVSCNSGLYSSSIMLQGKSSAFSYNSLGASQSFFEKKMTVNISVSEPFRAKRTFTSDYDTDDYTMHSYSCYSARYVRFSISYNFGQMNVAVKKASRGISNDDVKSGSGSSGGGGSN
jgi:outer membrane receptor protein involved in Fe transport